MGVAATDWDDIAKKEHLDELHTELKKLEVTVREVDQHMVALRKREEEMRDLNGKPKLKDISDLGLVKSSMILFLLYFTFRILG